MIKKRYKLPSRNLMKMQRIIPFTGGGDKS